MLRYRARRPRGQSTYGGEHREPAVHAAVEDPDGRGHQARPARERPGEPAHRQSGRRAGRAAPARAIRTRASSSHPTTGACSSSTRSTPTAMASSAPAAPRSAMRTRSARRTIPCSRPVRSRRARRRTTTTRAWSAARRSTASTAAAPCRDRPARSSRSPTARLDRDVQRALHRLRIRRRARRSPLQFDGSIAKCSVTYDTSTATTTACPARFVVSGGQAKLPDDDTCTFALGEKIDRAAYRPRQTRARTTSTPSGARRS